MKKLVLLFLLISVFLLSCGDVKDSNIGTIDTRCIEGHVYYYNNALYGGGIAPKLTDDGRPVHCEGEAK